MRLDPEDHLSSVSSAKGTRRVVFWGGNILGAMGQRVFVGSKLLTEATLLTGVRKKAKPAPAVCESCLILDREVSDIIGLRVVY